MRRAWQVLRDLLPLLPDDARRFFYGYIVASSALTILDVAAMSLLALVIAGAVNQTDVAIPLLGSFGVESTPWLVLLACVLIIIKSGASLLMHWFATRRFGRAEFEIGRRLLRAYIHSTWEERSKRTIAEMTRIADTGIANAIAGLVLTVALIPGYILTCILIFGVLVVSQPLTALVTILYLGLVALVINRVITRRALEASEVNLEYGYRVAILIGEMVDAIKELTLRRKLSVVASAVDERRTHAVRARANSSFLVIIPRYSYEAALIGGFALVGLVSYIASDFTGAVEAIALFAATGFRLVPAIAGLQSSVLDAVRAIPQTLDVINDLRNAEANVGEREDLDDSAQLPPQPQRLTLRGVTFSYPNAPDQVLRGIDLDVPLGSSLGIVGPSGAGKSTLIDVLLGLSSPTGGRIEIDDTPMTAVINAWRSRIGYVPQRVALFDGSIAQNVALTWDDDIDRDKVLEVLEKAQLTSLLGSREHGIDERIGERGVSLSGGQQQRLGIARALYTDPLVLVLDEATSSLDTKTEDDVIRSLKALRGEITLIAVAHRISTIKDYDQICYLDHGRILGSGSFAQLAEALPQFGLQVALAGLGGGAFMEGDEPANGV
jgi:ABC-type multidrug transport system fused ATPase/permease subunit